MQHNSSSTMENAEISCFRLKQLIGEQWEEYYSEICSDSSYNTTLYHTNSFKESDQEDTLVGVCDNQGLFKLLNFSTQTHSLFQVIITSYERETPIREFDDPITYRAQEISLPGVSSRWSQFQFLPGLSIVFSQLHSNKLYYVKLPFPSDVIERMNTEDESDLQCVIYTVAKMKYCIACVEVSTTGKYVAIASDKGELALHHIGRSVYNSQIQTKQLFTLDSVHPCSSTKEDESALTCMKFISDDLLATAGSDGHLKIHDTRTGMTIKDVLIETSRVNFMHMISFNQSIIRKLVVANDLGTLGIWTINTRLSNGWVSLTQTIYTSNGKQKVSIRSINHFEPPSLFEDDDSDKTLEQIEQETERRYRDCILVVSKSAKKHSIQFYYTDGHLLLQYGPFEHPVMFCDTVTSFDEDDIPEQRLGACCSNGAGYVWPTMQLLNDFSLRKKSKREGKSDTTDMYPVNPPTIDGEALGFVDCASDTTVDYGTSTPEETLSEVSYSEHDITDTEDDRHVSFIPRPEPYPQPQIRTYTPAPQQNKEKKQSFVIKHDPPMQPPKKPDLTTNKPPKDYNYGSLNKIIDTIQNQSTTDEIPSPKLNTTKLLQAKLQRKQQEKFDIDTDIIPKDDNDECLKVLNYAPSDRIFTDLPDLVDKQDELPDQIVIYKKKRKVERQQQKQQEVEKQSTLTTNDPIIHMKKRKVKKQVDSNYLKQLEEHKPVLEDLLFLGMYCLITNSCHCINTNTLR
jgi:hypothetical protein